MDMHGRILPSDTYSLLPLNQGWAKMASLIKEERALELQLMDLVPLMLYILTLNYFGWPTHNSVLKCVKV